MLKRIVLFVFGIFTTLFSFSQSGKIAGEITNTKNESVVNASIIIAGVKSGTKTDVDGNYFLSVTQGKCSLIISSINYSSKEIEVDVLASKTTVLDVVLEESDKNLQGVTIKSSARKESVNAMINFQRSTVPVAQGAGRFFIC